MYYRNIPVSIFTSVAQRSDMDNILSTHYVFRLKLKVLRTFVCSCVWPVGLPGGCCCPAPPASEFARALPPRARGFSGESTPPVRDGGRSGPSPPVTFRRVWVGTGPMLGPGVGLVAPPPLPEGGEGGLSAPFA